MLLLHLNSNEAKKVIQCKQDCTCVMSCVLSRGLPSVFVCLFVSLCVCRYLFVGVHVCVCVCVCFSGCES